MRSVWITKKKNRWLVGWYQSGKRKSKTLLSRAYAESYAADIKVKLDAGNATSICRVPWKYLLKEYFDSKEAQKLKPASITEIENTIRLFARFCGKINSIHITQEVIEKFKLLRGKEGISNFTLNKDLANLRAFIRFFSVDRAYIVPNLNLKNVKAIAKPVRALVNEQVKSLLQSLKRNNPDYYIRALLALSAALRCGTIDRLEISDIHFDRNTIDTWSSHTDKRWLDRPIQPAVMTELANYLSTNIPEGQIRLIAAPYRRERWLKLCRQAGIKTTFHNLRKTCCSLMQQNGVSTAVAARILEHSSPATTRKWYTDVEPAVKSATEALPVQEWIG